MMVASLIRDKSFTYGAKDVFFSIELYLFCDTIQ